MDLFIKRVELNQSAEFIKQSFREKNIAIINEVVFIPKQGYNGAVLHIDTWFNNQYVDKLMQDIYNSADGTTRFYFAMSKYWIVQKHHITPPATIPPPPPPIAPTLSIALTEPRQEQEQTQEQKEESAEIQNLRTLLYIATQRNKALEQRIMEYEHNDTRLRLTIGELNDQLFRFTHGLM